MQEARRAAAAEAFAEGRFAALPNNDGAMAFSNPEHDDFRPIRSLVIAGPTGPAEVAGPMTSSAKGRSFLLADQDDGADSASSLSLASATESFS
jgi:hypothetical protein